MRRRIGRLSAPRSCCWPARDWRTTLSPHGSTRHVKSSASGANASPCSDYPVLKSSRAVGDRRAFPPNVIVEIKALACELPSRRGLPLARWSLAELRREAIAHGLVAQISGTTLWRWLSQDALRPWRHRCWIFCQIASKSGSDAILMICDRAVDCIHGVNSRT